ncbi:MAG: 30S ribosomal protein S3 [Phototrophicaceae bacterium]
MGRKVHPIGFRLKINRDWDARWYAEKGRYVELLHEDRRIREMIKEKLAQAAVSRTEIERYPNQVVVHIHTARPGIVIGRKGDSIKDLRKDLERLTAGKKVKVEVTEIDKPDIEPNLVAESIADQLNRRIGHSRAMKRALGQAMRQGAEGIRIEMSGRLAGSDMARREWMSEGRIPRSTLRARVEYGFAEALTTFGRIGIKVWVYLGESLPTDEPQQEKKSPSAHANK